MLQSRSAFRTLANNRSNSPSTSRVPVDGLHLGSERLESVVQNVPDLGLGKNVLDHEGIEKGSDYDAPSKPVTLRSAYQVLPTFAQHERWISNYLRLCLRVADTVIESAEESRRL
jgi:hypothetical protein